MTAITLSTDPESKDNYGPYVPNISASCPVTGKAIRYNNVEDLQTVLEAHGRNTAAFIVEPIQGEAGVVVPDEDYLTRVQELCKKHNVLLICDEIQTGIGRTGRMLCSEWAGIKPDMVTLGKAISGGMYPVSAVLSRKDVMLVVEPGTHGSTYGGNPLGCAVSIRALEIMQEEDLTAKAEKLGNIFRDGLKALNNPIIKTIRGKGLLNAVVIDESAANGRTAWDLCILLKGKGLLVCNPTSLLTYIITYTFAQAKPTHGDIIRFAPPLVITEAEIRKGLSIIAEAVKELPNVEKSKGH
jgi:ornithine--oxo-acid transaminase